MTDETIAYFRRQHRRNYLRQHEKQRRADRKAEGAQRIDVTLRGEMLDDYATVRRYIEHVNRIGIERKIAFFEPFRLSATEVIAMALRTAAQTIREDEERARRQGLRLTSAQ